MNNFIISEILKRIFFAVLNTRVAFKAVIKVRSGGILNASQL